MFAALKVNAWAYPALEVGHLLGISLLIGNLVLLELRVFGMGASLPAMGLARLGLGLVATGFMLAAVTGLLMFATQSAELLSNRAFTLKMLLLVFAACNAAWFHGRNSLARLDFVARLQMVVSSIIWLAVVVCGRWIAYI